MCWLDRLIIGQMVESIPFKALFDAYEKESVALYGEARVKESRGIVHEEEESGGPKIPYCEGNR